MKLLLILTLFAFALNLWALTPETTPEDKLLPLINKEIKLLSSGGKNISLFTRYRLFELHVEKLRAIYNQENRTFIQSATTTKDLAFLESRKLYSLCKKMGNDLLSRGAQPKMVAAIYYAMALNDRDYAFENKTENYFLKALTAANGFPAVKNNVQVTLAEYYYNEKKYDKAYRLYQIIITTIDTKWHAKNLLNAAWTSVMLKKFQEGVDLLQAAAKYAQETNNMGPMSLILDAAPLFFLEANQYDEGITFIKTYGATEQINILTKMHRRASSKGFYEWCENINALIEKMPLETQADWDSLKAYRTYVFDHYRNFSKKEEIFKLIDKFNFIFKNNHYTEEESTVISEKYKDYLLYMQTSLLKNFIKGSSDLSNDEKRIHREIDGIADFLISFDAKNAAFYYFHKGEISLALHMHPKAVNEYFTALERYGISAQPADNPEIKKVFNSLFATLNPEVKYQSLNKAALSTQTLKAYKYYITIFPSLETSKEIYQKSFLLHLDEKLYQDAEQLLSVFQAQYPAEKDAAKRMTKSLIDRYIKDKSIENIARWATFLNENKSFDMAEMKTLTQSLANLHLDQNKVKEVKNKTEALDDLDKLFNDKIYDDETRTHFSRKALVLSLEIFDQENTKTWIKRFIKLNPKLTTEDTKLITVAAKLFHDRREYSMAHESFKKINSISRINGNELELATINAFLMTGSKLNKTLKLIEEFGVDKNDPAVTKTVQWMISNLYYQSKFSEISTVPAYYSSFIKISDLLFYYYSPIHQKEHTEISNIINLFFPEQLEKMKVSEVNLKLLKEKISIFKKQTLVDKTPFNPEQFSAKVGAFLEYYKAIDDLVFPQDFGIKDIVIEGRKSAFLHLSETLTKYNPITSDKDLKRAVKGELKKIIKKLKKKYPYL